MDRIIAFLNTWPWYAWIPIVAILCGTILSIIRMHIRHKERIAMIRQGIHPDFPPDEQPTSSEKGYPY